MPERVGMTVPLLRVWMWAVLVAIYSGLSLLKSYPPFVDVPEIPAGLDAALSFALALIIAFRMNRAYERWWEARTLWGTLVNVSRNLAVKIRELQCPNTEECGQASDLIVAFALGLKDHLRDDPDLRQLPGFESDQSTPGHLPSYIVRRLYRLFERWKSEGMLSDGQLWVLDREARVLLDVCGGCERIKTTLMSISWRSFTRQCIVVYLLVLPWGLVDDFGVWTIPLTFVTAYFVIAGEGIAHHIEEPFGTDEDHLDLKNVTESIRRSVREVLTAR